jgi:hypothetical protein
VVLAGRRRVRVTRVRFFLQQRRLCLLASYRLRVLGRICVGTASTKQEQEIFVNSLKSRRIKSGQIFVTLLGMLKLRLRTMNSVSVNEEMNEEAISDCYLRNNVHHSQNALRRNEVSIS